MAEVNSVGKFAVFYAKYPTITALAKLVPGVPRLIHWSSGERMK